MAFLAQTYGAFPDSLSFGISASPSSYTSSLSGTYGGSGLSISYTGNLSGYTPTISWTGTGSYGANTWSSNGAATFTFPTATTFQEVYASSSTVGAHSETTSVTISGVDGPVNYTGMSGSAIADGKEDCYVELSLSLPKGLPPKVGEPTENDGVKGKKVGNGCLGYFVTTTDKVESVTSVNGLPTALTDTGTLTVASHAVPEPPAMSLLAAGLLALAGVVGVRSRRTE